MKKIILLIALILPLYAYSQLTAYRNVVSNGYNFWLYQTDDTLTQASGNPLIIFLHGRSLCGTDLNRVRRYGTLHALTMGRKIDAMIMAPQNPGGPWNPNKILNVLQWVEANFDIDTQRVYVVGMSLGGYGTLDFVGTYPEKIAAAMALCGGSTLKNYCGLNTVPLWIIHGTADSDVPLQQSQNVVDAMNACGNTNLLRFDKFPGVDHGRLACLLYMDETYQWLLCHSKANPDYVNKDIILTAPMMANAYDGMDKTANKFDVIDNGNIISENSPQQTEASKSSANRDNGTKYHTVKQGDTLYAISKRYHTTVTKLCKLNRIKETSILRLGQKIKVR